MSSSVDQKWYLGISHMYYRNKKTFIYPSIFNRKLALHFMNDSLTPKKYGDFLSIGKIQKQCNY